MLSEDSDKIQISGMIQSSQETLKLDCWLYECSRSMVEPTFYLQNLFSSSHHMYPQNCMLLRKYHNPPYANHQAIFMNFLCGVGEVPCRYGNYYENLQQWGLYFK